MNAAGPAIALAVPAIGALLIPLAGRWPNLREAITLTTALALLYVVASLVPEVMAGERPSVTLFSMLPGLSIEFTVEVHQVKPLAVQVNLGFSNFTCFL